MVIINQLSLVITTISISTISHVIIIISLDTQCSYLSNNHGKAFVR
jgi:hypothetical protein